MPIHFGRIVPESVFIFPADKQPTHILAASVEERAAYGNLSPTRKFYRGVQGKMDENGEFEAVFLPDSTVYTADHMINVTISPPASEDEALFTCRRVSGICSPFYRVDLTNQDLFPESKRPLEDMIKSNDEEYDKDVKAFFLEQIRDAFNLRWRILNARK